MLCFLGLYLNTKIEGKKFIYLFMLHLKLMDSNIKGSFVVMKE